MRETAAENPMNRHLLDLCRRSERTASWVYSAFLSPAEQEDFVRCPESAQFAYTFEGGHIAAERKLLAAGDEALTGMPPAPPLRVISVKPLSPKFAEDLSHRDYLGSILSLGIDRSLIGDILVRDREGWFFCLDSVAEFITSSLTRIRKTSVSATLSSADAPELLPRFATQRLNVVSERPDAIIAAFSGLSRSQAAALFSAEKVFVNGRVITDRSARLREGDVISVRGFGKAIYDGIEHETRKGRLWVCLRRFL